MQLQRKPNWGTNLISLGRPNEQCQSCQENYNFTRSHVAIKNTHGDSRRVAPKPHGQTLLRQQLCKQNSWLTRTVHRQSYAYCRLFFRAPRLSPAYHQSELCLSVKIPEHPFASLSGPKQRAYDSQRAPPLHTSLILMGTEGWCSVACGTEFVGVCVQAYVCVCMHVCANQSQDYTSEACLAALWHGDQFMSLQQMA